MSLYLGSFSVSFITLIQAFWLVALAVAERIAISPLLSICLRDRLDLVLADQLRRDLVDEHAARVGRDVGVHADDLHAALGGLLERRGDRVRVVAGDDDRVRLLLHGGVDDRDLRRGAGVGRAGDAVRAAELLHRLVDAGVLELLVRVAELLRDRDRLEALLELGARDRRRRRLARDDARRAARLVVLRRAAGGDDEHRDQGEHGEQHAQSGRDFITSDPPQGVGWSGAGASP